LRRLRELATLADAVKINPWIVWLLLHASRRDEGRDEAQHYVNAIDPATFKAIADELIELRRDAKLREKRLPDKA
jgi:hypothetical protein